MFEKCIYIQRENESTFLEIIETHKKDKTNGCIYKHPNVHVSEFSNDYMGPPLEKNLDGKRTFDG